MMSDKGAMLILLLILSLVLVSLPQIETVKAEPKMIVVPDDYAVISWAIGNASEGDTIFVKRGNHEGPINQTLIVNKAISIIGENQNTTKLSLHPEWLTIIIVATTLSHYADPIKIEANDVKISGLTITSDGGEISANGNRIQITGNTFGVNVILRGSNQLFTENTLIESSVFCRGTYASVSKNKVYDGIVGSDAGSHDEIFANNVTGSIAIVGTSKYELVYDNTVRDGSDLYRAGISIASIGTSVANNTISNCSRGISQDWGYNNTVRGNVIVNNRGPALKVTEGYNFTFFQNYVADNPVGMQIDTTFALYQNSFVNNDLQVEILDDNIYFWSMDNGKIGNYWSDYTEKDADGDGIGDTPYIVDEQIRDNHPLMEPVIIPEFSSWVLLPLLITATLLIIFCKQRLPKNTKTTIILGD